MNFSISIPYGLENWQAFFDIFYNEYFCGVELPADYLSEKKLKLLLNKNGQRVTNVVDILDSSLLRNVALQEKSVKNKIFGHINDLLIKDYGFKIDNFLIDLGFSVNNQKTEDDSLRTTFLKNFCFSLYHKEKFLCIPVNINSGFETDLWYKYYLGILDNAMFNYFKLSMNIFPHELKKNFSSLDVYKNLIFYVKNIRLIYEPDTGNYLSEKLLRYWIEPLLKYGFSGDIIIVPKTTNDFVYESEVKKISNNIEKLNRSLL